MSALPRNAPRTWPPHRLTWRRSSYSTGTNNCLETARLGDGRLAVRDSKDTARTALRFGAGAWTSFVTAVRAPGGTAGKANGGPTDVS